MLGLGQSPLVVTTAQTAAESSLSGQRPGTDGKNGGSSYETSHGRHDGDHHPPDHRLARRRGQG